MISGDDPEARAMAKNGIIAAFVGIIIIAITVPVVNLIGEGFLGMVDCGYLPDLKTSTQPITPLQTDDPGNSEDAGSGAMTITGGEISDAASKEISLAAKGKKKGQETKKPPAIVGKVIDKDSSIVTWHILNTGTTDLHDLTVISTIAGTDHVVCTGKTEPGTVLYPGGSMPIICVVDMPEQTFNSLEELGKEGNTHVLLHAYVKSKEKATAVLDLQVPLSQLGVETERPEVSETKKMCKDLNGECRDDDPKTRKITGATDCADTCYETRLSVLSSDETTAVLVVWDETRPENKVYGSKKGSEEKVLTVPVNARVCLSFKESKSAPGTSIDKYDLLTELQQVTYMGYMAVDDPICGLDMYSSPGKYYVDLIVTDSAKVSSTVSVTVIVKIPDTEESSDCDASEAACKACSEARSKDYVWAFPDEDDLPGEEYNTYKKCCGDDPDEYASLSSKEGIWICCHSPDDEVVLGKTTFKCFPRNEMIDKCESKEGFSCSCPDGSECKEGTIFLGARDCKDRCCECIKIKTCPEMGGTCTCPSNQECTVGNRKFGALDCESTCCVCTGITYKLRLLFVPFDWSGEMSTKAEQDKFKATLDALKEKLVQKLPLAGCPDKLFIDYTFSECNVEIEKNMGLAVFTMGGYYDAFIKCLEGIDESQVKNANYVLFVTNKDLSENLAGTSYPPTDIIWGDNFDSEEGTAIRILHELGHTWGLADEYFDGCSCNPVQPDICYNHADAKDPSCAALPCYNPLTLNDKYNGGDASGTEPGSWKTKPSPFCQAGGTSKCSNNLYSDCEGNQNSEGGRCIMSYGKAPGPRYFCDLCMAHLNDLLKCE